MCSLTTHSPPLCPILYGYEDPQVCASELSMGNGEYRDASVRYHGMGGCEMHKKERSGRNEGDLREAIPMPSGVVAQFDDHLISTMKTPAMGPGIHCQIHLKSSPTLASTRMDSQKS